MCFSAAGSFALSGVLAGVGVAAVARCSSPRHRLFAAIPLIFAAQQASEGVVWLTMATPAHAIVQRVAVIAFLGFALVVWPAWLPVSLRVVERDADRRRALTATCVVGFAVSICSAVLLVRSTPVAVVAGRSIRYDHSGGGNAWLDAAIILAYLVPTIGPFFISTAQLARQIGALLLISLVAAALVEREALTSVWCFFAAILSGTVYLSIRQEELVASPARTNAVSREEARHRQ